jgi:hypothetical protein
VVRAIGPAALVALAVIAACGQPAGPLSIGFLPPTSTSPAMVRVIGLSSAELSSLGAMPFDDDAWAKLMRVSVVQAAPDAPPIAGRFTVTSSSLDFTPRYPFDPGRQYVATFDPSRLLTRRGAAVVRSAFSLPARDVKPTTTVVRMLPTSDTLPENLLRVYLEFSAPMAREHGRDFLTLKDEHGGEVKDAFLALDVDFWSPDGRRYTVFFDPGRVKRGILPNDEFGRALLPGHRFTLVVDPRWRDANGQPLASAFEHSFAVGPADMAPLSVNDWKIQPPAAATRDPVVVTFPKPLDHGLLQRALGVARGTTAVTGDIAIGAGETEWRFTPRDPWPAGRCDLVVLSILEDPMGNKIGRPFDIDAFDQIDKSPAPDRTTVPFIVKSPQ